MSRQETIDGTGADYDAGEEKDIEIDQIVEVKQKCKITGVKVKAGHRKTVEVVLTIPYDSEDTAQLNDLLGEYGTMSIEHTVYKPPITEKQKDDLNQIKFDFGNEVGA